MEAVFENKDVSIKVLRPNTKNLICDLLNPEMYISSTNGILRYWRGLAGLCGIPPIYEPSLVEDASPTSKVLTLWYEQNPEKNTIKQFLLFLQEMDRCDVIDDVIDLIDEDIRVQKANSQKLEVKQVSLEADKYVITTDDARRINEGLALQNFDAFLLYDHEDVDFAIRLLQTMENEYNIKLCVRDRNLVGGGLEMDKIITLITERCNRVVVILSDSFFKSSCNDYLLRFAHAYEIGNGKYDTEGQRKIIPCVYKELTSRPSYMEYLFTLDFRRTSIIFNFWSRLNDSIKVADLEKMSIIRSSPDIVEQSTFNLDISVDNLEPTTQRSKKKNKKKFIYFFKRRPFKKEKTNSHIAVVN